MAQGPMVTVWLSRDWAPADGANKITNKSANDLRIAHPLSPSSFLANNLAAWIPGFFRRFLAGENKKVAFRLFSKKTQIGPCQIFKFRFVGGSAFGLSLCAELRRPWQILFTLGHPRDPELTGPTPRMCLLTNGSLSNRESGPLRHPVTGQRQGGKAAKSTRLAQSAARR